MSDMTFGMIVTAIFLVLVFGAGYLLYLFKNARLAREWTPLLPLVEGAAIRGDSGGAATSYLTGTYRGRRVQASLSPDVAKYSGESGHYANRFIVALLDVPGAHDFRITAAPALRNFGRDSWRIESKNDAVRDALAATNAIALVSAMGDVEVYYERSGRALRFHEDVRPLKVAPPDRFRQELDMLIALADVVTPINRPAAPDS